MVDLNRITGRSLLVGLIGWPVEYSLSPAMHNAAFVDLGLDWVYVPLSVQPNSHLTEALRGLAALNFVGVNVAVPHKQAVMRYLDEIDDVARLTGAVNTIHIENGRYRGYNTDAQGFLNALIEANCSPKGLRVAVLGAGGAARAVVVALARADARSVTVFNRTAERAAFLVEDLIDFFPDRHLQFAPLASEALAAMRDEVDLIINTTSVGMSPNIDRSPWPEDVPIPKHAIFYDTVYNPLETQFLGRARAFGNPTVDGLGMLVHQGAHAFEIWTGQQPSPAIMRAACLDGLGIKKSVIRP